MAWKGTVRVKFAGGKRRTGDKPGTPVTRVETSVPEWGYNE